MLEVFILKSDRPIHTLLHMDNFQDGAAKNAGCEIFDPLSAPCRPLCSAGLPFVSLSSTGTYEMSRKERNVEFLRVPLEISERGTDGSDGGGEQPAGRRCHRLISRH